MRVVQVGSPSVRPSCSTVCVRAVFCLGRGWTHLLSRVNTVFCLGRGWTHLCRARCSVLAEVEHTFLADWALCSVWGREWARCFPAGQAVESGRKATVCWQWATRLPLSHSRSLRLAATSMSQTLFQGMIFSITFPVYCIHYRHCYYYIKGVPE